MRSRAVQGGKRRNVRLVVDEEVASVHVPMYFIAYPRRIYIHDENSPNGRYERFVESHLLRQSSFYRREEL
jgi:hypothetical protein